MISATKIKALAARARQGSDGLKYLGGGCYGQAYRIAPGVVVKYGYQNDISFDVLTMVALRCRETGRRFPHMVEVYHTERYPHDRREWFALMEEVEVVGGGWNHPFPYSYELQEELGSWLYETGHSVSDDDTGEDVFDMHGNNWGYNAAGLPVCFDPVARGESFGYGTPLPKKITPPPRRYGPQRHGVRW